MQDDGPVSANDFLNVRLIFSIHAIFAPVIEWSHENQTRPPPTRNPHPAHHRAHPVGDLPPADFQPGVILLVLLLILVPRIVLSTINSFQVGFGLPRRSFNVGGSDLP
jgi:hypothetical protein